MLTLRNRFLEAELDRLEEVLLPSGPSGQNASNSELETQDNKSKYVSVNVNTDNRIDNLMNKE